MLFCLRANMNMLSEGILILETPPSEVCRLVEESLTADDAESEGVSV